MADGQVSSRAELEERLIAKATRDTEFRQRLVSDPRHAIEAELGLTVPAGLNVKVVEESSGEYYLVLPPVSAQRGEVSDEELSAAAGGSGCWIPGISG